jgi:hypothetical protein
MTQEYNITLTARYEGSSAVTSDTVTLIALGSPLSAQLSGPSGTVHSTKGNLTFDARGSVDPDDPGNAASEMSYLWSCQNAVDLSPCFGTQVDGVWSIDPSKVSGLKQTSLHCLILLPGCYCQLFYNHAGTARATLVLE